MDALDRVIAGITCREVLAELSAFLDGTLSAERVAQVRAHLEGCRECDRFGTAVASMLALVREKLSAPAPLEAGVERRLHDRLQRARSMGRM